VLLVGFAWGGKHSQYTSLLTSIMPPCDLSADESTCPYLNSPLEIKSFVNIIWTWNIVKTIISCPLFCKVFLFLAKICVMATKKQPKYNRYKGFFWGKLFAHIMITLWGFFLNLPYLDSNLRHVANIYSMILKLTVAKFG
jgi:hypothetical protein